MTVLSPNLVAPTHIFPSWTTAATTDEVVRSLEEGEELEPKVRRAWLKTMSLRAAAFPELPETTVWAKRRQSLEGEGGERGGG